MLSNPTLNEAIFGDVLIATRLLDIITLSRVIGTVKSKATFFLNLVDDTQPQAERSGSRGCIDCDPRAAPL